MLDTETGSTMVSGPEGHQSDSDHFRMAKRMKEQSKRGISVWLSGGKKSNPPMEEPSASAPPVPFGCATKFTSLGACALLYPMQFWVSTEEPYTASWWDWSRPWVAWNYDLCRTLPEFWWFTFVWVTKEKPDMEQTSDQGCVGEMWSPTADGSGPWIGSKHTLGSPAGHFMS